MNNFEERLAKLEELGAKIQHRDVTLEEALKCFEDGIKLARGMEKELEKIEGKVQQLLNGDDIDSAPDSDDEEAPETAPPAPGAPKKRKPKAPPPEPVLGLFEA
jgi:exodeoxyribonuclease VII small subunit